jgi:hypothetical protein
MEAFCSSEKSVDTQRTTRHYIPEVDTIHNHRCENLKSYKVEDNYGKVYDVALNLELKDIMFTVWHAMSLPSELKSDSPTCASYEHRAASASKQSVFQRPYCFINPWNVHISFIFQFVLLFLSVHQLKR